MALHPSRELLSESESDKLCRSSKAQQLRPQLKEMMAVSSLPISHVKGSQRTLSREQSIREAVLLSFCDPLPDRCLLLLYVSPAEWKALLDWLDISGLALYFLDRMMELQLSSQLPRFVIGRLHQNLIDNSARTSGMIGESAAIQLEFQKARLSYAVLKGFSLCPSSVPRPELRHQFDLDFLVAEKSAPEARQILERRGYHAYTISRRTWEFKISAMPVFSLNALYKDLPGRSVELHVEADIPGQPSTLHRAELRDFYGLTMPVLSPVDQFLRQGLHAYKDICDEFSRASHLVEFRRHVLARRDDRAFWSELQSVAQHNQRASLGLGLVTQLITHVMGDFAPEALTSWTVCRLPSSVLFWIEVYGRQAVFKKFPGNKLYVLLQKELESAGIPAKRPLGRALLPLRMPPAVVRASANESVSLQIRRYRLQLHQILSRLRFHIVEGLRYTWESYRWRQMNRVVR